MTYRALDFVFRCDADPTIAPMLGRALEPLRTSSSHDEETRTIVVERRGDDWTITEGSDALAAKSIGVALARTLELVNRRAAASLGQLVPLHAAAVRAPGSSMIVALAGTSGAGKSTLGAAAIRAGWGFIAEEIAAVDSTSRHVRTFHRSIGLRSGGAGALGIEFPHDDPIHSDVFPWPVPHSSRVAGGTLAGIALVSRRDAPIAVSDVRPARALAELIEHCVVPDDNRVVNVFRDLEALVRRVPVVHLNYDTPADGVHLLGELERRWS